jgi:uncharacterized protein YjiS (DUF1127 family)
MSNSMASPSGLSTATLRLPAAGWAAVLWDGIGRCVAWIRYRRQVRRAIETLTDFDDHLLADLGLSRDQIKKAARAGYLPGYPKR